MYELFWSLEIWMITSESCVPRFEFMCTLNTLHNHIHTQYCTYYGVPVLCVHIELEYWALQTKFFTFNVDQYLWLFQHYMNMINNEHNFLHTLSMHCKINKHLKSYTFLESLFFVLFNIDPMTKYENAPLIQGDPEDSEAFYMSFALLHPV